MKKHLILFGLFFAFGLFVFSSFHVSKAASIKTNSPLERGEHPRIFFSADSRQKVIDRIRTHYSTDFQAFIKKMDEVYGQSFANGQSQNLRISDVRNFAFLCQIDPAIVGVAGRPRAEYCAEAVRLAKAMATSLSSYTDGIHCGQNWASQDCGLFNISLAVAYDWAYKDMNAEDKTLLRTALEKSFERRSDDANGDRELLMNKATTDALHGVFPFLAIYKDGSALETDMRAWFDTYFLNGMLTVGDKLFSNSAYHHEGDTYSGDVMVPLALMASAAASAMNENLFETHPYLAGFLDYYYYTIIPQKTPYAEGYAGERNNTHSNGYVWMPNDAPFLALSAVANALRENHPQSAGFGRWLAEGPSPYGIGDSKNLPYYDIRRFDLFTKFLWGMRGITPLSAEEAGRSLSKYLGGEYVIRSSHDSEAATRIAFHSTIWWYPQGHNDDEQTAIGIWKYGPLILDSTGNSKNTKDMRKLESGKGPATNSILGLFDPHEKDQDNGYNLMEFGMPSVSEKEANNPNQYFEGSPLDIGDTTYEQTSQHDYVRYDYSKSYSRTKKANTALRQLIYLRGSENNEFVIVFDTVNSALEKRALFHTAVDPQAIGWTASENGFLKLVDSNSAIRIDNSSLPSGKGALYLRAFGPKTSIYKKGGATAPWIDAAGTPLAISSGSGKFEYECFSIGCHHLQVRTQSPNLVTVMQIGRASTLSQMTPITEVVSSNAYGVLINKQVVVSAITHNPSTFVAYELSPSLPTEHLVTNLKPNTAYAVNVGTKSITLTTTPRGTLRFSDTIQGTHIISLTSSDAPTSDILPPSIISFSISPSQGASETTAYFEVSDDTMLKTVSLFRAPDVGGAPGSFGNAPYKEVIITGNSYQGTISDSALLSGTSWYQLKVTDESHKSNVSQPQKFIKLDANTNIPPTARISASPLSGTEPLSVSFSGSNSYDPDSSIISYTWNFGDGWGSNLVDVSHTYLKPGHYVAELIVTDSKGATHKNSVTISVLPKNITPTSTPPGSVLYVDAAVAQSGNGSKELPFKRIQEALKNVMPGGTIIIRGTTATPLEYAEELILEKNGLPQNPIKVTTLPGEKVVIASTKTIKLDKHWYIFENLMFNHKNAASDALVVSGEHITFNSIELKNGQRDGIQINSSARTVEIRNSMISNFVWKPGSDAHCIVIDPGAENVTIDSSKLTHCGGDGLQIYATNSTAPSAYAKNIRVINSTFTTTLGSGSENAIDVKGVQGMIIEKNQIHGFKNKALVFQKGPRDVRISGNRIWGSDRGIEVRAEGGQVPKNFEIINNVVFDITGQYALKFDSAENVLIAHNTLTNITGNSIRTEGKGIVGGTIQNNLISKAGTPSIAASVNTIVSHNGWFNGAKAGSLTSKTDTLASDPQFINPIIKDFHLKAASPAINAGITLNLVSQDFDSTIRPQANFYDLGAYENSSSITPPQSGKPSVTLSLSVDKRTARPGDILTYTLTYTNTSRFVAKNLKVSTVLPEPSEYIENSATQNGSYTQSNRTLGWTINELSGSTFGSLHYKVRVLPKIGR